MEQIEVTPDQFDAIVDLSEYAGSIAYSKDGTRAYFVEIGPTLAERILKTYNTDYRKLRVKHAKSLADDMKSGNWMLDGSPIRINELNELSDGQHRLTAIENSGQRIEFLVVDKLPVEAYDTMDTNALSRTYVDILRRRGFAFCPDRAAVSGLLWKWNRNYSLDTSVKLTVAQLDSIHTRENAERIGWAVKNANNLSRNVHVKRALLGFCLYVLGEVNEGSIKELLFAVSNMENLNRGTPARALAIRLRNDKNNDRYKIGTNDETMWLIFRAWRDYHRNTYRHADDQIKLEGLTLPPNGVTVSDLKNMVVMD